jgi:hypothetical protein
MGAGPRLIGRRETGPVMQVRLRILYRMRPRRPIPSSAPPVLLRGAIVGGCLFRWRSLQCGSCESCCACSLASTAGLFAWLHARPRAVDGFGHCRLTKSALRPFQQLGGEVTLRMRFNGARRYSSPHPFPRSSWVLW